MMRSVAIIPARGGSKRIPRKNIKLFLGKPMLSYSISVALESGLFEHVVVSTEDDEIADVATQWGAEVPFRRPRELADDVSPTVPVIAHAVGECTRLGWTPDVACCIYPCVPLLTVETLREGYARLLSAPDQYHYPVIHHHAPIQRALRRSADGKLSPIYPEYELTRSQDLEPTFFDAGQFYWGATATWLSGEGLQSNGNGFELAAWQAVDIDTEADWKRAEQLAQLKSGPSEK